MAFQKEAQETESGRILAFRPRISLGATKNPKPNHYDVPIDDLQKYERDGEPDDYRRRMIINVIAFTFIVALTFAGIWLADQMAMLRKHQDCALSGRKNCADIEAIVQAR